MEEQAMVVVSRGLRPPDGLEQSGEIVRGPARG